MTTAFFACTKHAYDVEAAATTNGATIVFSAPTANAVYQTGDSISIQAIAIAPQTIHGYDVSIKQANDTTVYFFQHVHDHNDTLLINHKWKSNLPGAMALEAKIVLTLDHDGHTATKSVAFNVR